MMIFLRTCHGNKRIKNNADDEHLSHVGKVEDPERDNYI